MTWRERVLSDIVCHVIGGRLTQETKVQSALHVEAWRMLLATS